MHHDMEQGAGGLYQRPNKKATRDRVALVLSSIGGEVGKRDSIRIAGNKKAASVMGRLKMR